MSYAVPAGMRKNEVAVPARILRENELCCACKNEEE